MKTFLNEAKFILLFLGVMTVISGMSNLDLDSEAHSSVKPDLRANLESENIETKWTARSPASIPEPSPLALEKDFFCNHSFEGTKAQKISKSMVMLNFKLCKQSKLIESVSVSNETNGFRAQIFKSNDSKFKTDYIQLNSGSNKIIVEVILKDGQKNVDSLEILSGS